PSVAIHVTSPDAPVIVVSGVLALGNSSTLEIELSGSFSNGTEIPILKAGLIEGTFAEVTVIAPSDDNNKCQVSGSVRQTSTTIAVLLCVACCCFVQSYRRLLISLYT